MKNNYKPVNKTFYLTFIATSIVLSGCSYMKVDPYKNSFTKGNMFTETKNVIPFEPLSRRKWDSALITDFDKDGYQDVLILSLIHI